MKPAPHQLAVALLLVTSAACAPAPSTSSTGGAGGATPTAGTGGVGGDTQTGIFDDTRFIESCASLGHACGPGADPKCGQCQYRIHFDRAACSADKPCDNLFLLWAFMGCESDSIQGLLDGIVTAHPGWVTACVQPIYPGESLPGTLGAPAREQTVITELFGALTTSAEAGAWTGKNLLMGGCSFGATRYPVVAARFADEAQWLGTGKNAACFSDGVVSVGYQDSFVGEMVASGAPACAMRHQRVAEGYTVDSATDVHICASSPGGQCACDLNHASKPFPGECGGEDCVSFETIVAPSAAGFDFAQGVSAESFAVPSWRLVSEGDAYRDTADRCKLDIVPEAPFKALCELIDADPGKSCSFVSLPSAGHCTDYMKNIGTLCVDWFEAL